jgi:ribose 5-phosphate isomerase B
VLGGSGNGEQIAANKVKGVRAALVWSIETAKLAREHNNANVISLGGRMHDEALCLQLVDTFLATKFTNDERHVRRISQIAKFEENGKI